MSALTNPMLDLFMSYEAQYFLIQDIKTCNQQFPGLQEFA